MNIQFTYETKDEFITLTLDVSLHREGSNIITNVYRKLTNKDMYVRWNHFTPVGSKKERLQNAHSLFAQQTNF